MQRASSSTVVLAISFLILSTSGNATPLASQMNSGDQTAPVVSFADYARAESFLSANTTSKVFGVGISPTWLDGDRFWYRTSTTTGVQFTLVDGDGETRRPAFDHEALAQALQAESGTAVDANALPFSSIEFSSDNRAISFIVEDTFYTCQTDGSACTSEGTRSFQPTRNESLSPDGSTVVFIRDWNLWSRNVATNVEIQLTKDGVEDYGYATDNAGWTYSDRPVVLWSPDSRSIATFQQDQRGVGEMYLVSTEVGHPTLEAWKYPLPGDSIIPMIERVIVHLDGPQVVRLQMPADEHRSTICDHVFCRGQFTDVEWSEDASTLAFVSSSRDHKIANLRLADPRSGAVTDVLEERVETFFESGAGRVNWHMFKETGEAMWFSQHTNWGHIYLHDLETGERLHAITEGDWNVLQVLHIDLDKRTAYFTGAGREPGDPYFQYFYSVGLDGKNLTLLTPDSANHQISLAPDNRSFVDQASTPVDPGSTVLRDMKGKKILDIEIGDITRLVQGGWIPPTPFSVLARDGVTDLHGLMYKPTNLDPDGSYPIIAYVYPGPQSGSVGGRSFNPARRDKQAIAELGFIVMEVDAMGTPGRSKSFHEAYYGNMGDNGLPDQILAMQQLAERHPWIDIDKAGIYGHSGGGFATASALLRHPDFFKVGVSQAGNHDNRNYEDDWGEKWQGLLETNADGSTNYDNQANQLVAGNLKGKLLIAHGTMDNNVPPSNTMLLVDALIAENKDFDLIMFPNRRHGFGNEPYMMRRRWDYFVRHLLGATPPAYEIGADRTPVS